MLNGTDEGLCVLALHSLIEACANARSPRIAALEHFGEKMNVLLEEIGRCDPETRSSCSVVSVTSVSIKNR